MDHHHQPLLRTKLHRPAVPVDHVRRGELLERLEEQPRRPAVLVSAPAGYGKSTLVACWLEECGRPGAWLSLDEGDNDLHRFLSHFVGAVRSLFAGTLRETTALLASPTAPPIPVLASTLVNELDELEGEFILVLDDIHCIREAAVHELLDLILQRPPRSMQLALVGRRDPVLPIASLRAKGKLTELRMQELRFTVEEATAFLRGAIGEDLDEAAAVELAGRAEGWVTGLRLAVLARGETRDSGRGLLELKGTTRLVVDYLIAEVLDHQQAGIRRRLLCTSILRRFCAPLCEALLEGSGLEEEPEIDGDVFIDWLWQHNLFVVPLDAEGRWLRYHHLFGELLGNELKRAMSAEEIAALHSRASAWLEGQGAIDEALHHALAAGDAEGAADIVERHRDAAFDENRWPLVKGWLERIPQEVKWNRIRLLLAEAEVFNETFRLQDVPAVVERAAELAEASPVDPAVRGELLHFQGFVRYWQGDGPASQAFLERALELVPESPGGLTRAQLELFVGLAMHLSGREDEALRRLEAWIATRHLRTGVLFERLVFGLAVIHLMSGELAPAGRRGREMLEDSRRTGSGFIQTWADYLLGVVAFHELDLEDALRHFGQVVKHRYAAHTRGAIDALVGSAIAAQLLARPKEADESLHVAGDYARWSGDQGSVEVVLSCEARLALLRGNLDTALRWQRGFRLSPYVPGMLFFLANANLTECRVLAAAGTDAALREAAEKLEFLRRETSALHYTGQSIEVAVLQALVAARRGGEGEALELLQRAVALSSSGGWIRPFVEIGAPMAELLQSLPEEGPEVAHGRKILAAFGDGPTAATGRQALSDPLTHRELDVLELLARRLQNKEIAARLSVSPITVKTHLRSIYLKLDVSKRREAVERAVELGLVR